MRHNAPGKMLQNQTPNGPFIQWRQLALLLFTIHRVEFNIGMRTVG